MEGAPLKIGFAGLGTVGQGVWATLVDHADRMAAAAGRPLVPSAVAVRDRAKPRDVAIPETAWCADALSVATDPEVDVVCELMGGVEQALAVTLAALQAGKPVVTANKALLAEHGPELFATAQAHETRLAFEASVAGGIPVIKALAEGLAANRFPLIYGILNGTCNYILTRMAREQVDFGPVLDDARQLGYVEADEALDLDGLDAAHKAIILTWLAHGVWLPLAEMPVEGIRQITLEDIAAADALGYRVKLVGIIERDFEGGTVATAVQPMLLPAGTTLANVNDAFNGVSLSGDVVGESTLIGRGAGRFPTASAVLADLVDCARGRGFDGQVSFPGTPPIQATPAQIQRAFYLRLHVADRPGVLAEVAALMAGHGISIATMTQRPVADHPGQAALVFTTHRTTEAAMASALEELAEAPFLASPAFRMRIAPFA